jgi:hypothetical protein
LEINYLEAIPLIKDFIPKSELDQKEWNPRVLLEEMESLINAKAVIDKIRAAADCNHTSW